jgi:hypothetical protein
MIRWIRQKLEERKAGDRLFNELAEHRNVATGDLFFIHKISDATALKLLKFMSQRTPDHDSLPADLVRALSRYSDVASRVNIIIRNFDRAVEMGWTYSPNAVRFVLEAIDEVRGNRQFTPEQEEALLLLENSRWIKEYTHNGGSMKTKYRCHPCVRGVVVERPQDVEEIIEVASRHFVETAPQLIAILDGDVDLPLSGGAL